MCFEPRVIWAFFIRYYDFVNSIRECHIYLNKRVKSFFR